MPAFCAVCKKNLGLLPFTCKCKEDFCSLHRCPENHKCPFDFRADAKEHLERANKSFASVKFRDKI